MNLFERHFEAFEIGESRRSGGRTITEADIVRHAGETGDFYPHHMDAEWCSQQPFGQRIAHGTLILSVAVGMLSDAVNLAAMSYGYDRVRFIRPIFIGDTITVEARIDAKRDHPKQHGHGIVDEVCTVTNQRDEVVLVLTHVYLVQRAGAPT